MNRDSPLYATKRKGLTYGDLRNCVKERKGLRVMEELTKLGTGPFHRQNKGSFPITSRREALQGNCSLCRIKEGRAWASVEIKTTSWGAAPGHNVGVGNSTF